MKRVLIVDDNQVLANVYRNALSSAGFAVEVAKDGEAGVAAARKTPPDVILLDLMMPRMNGVDMLKSIRADQALSGVPVIIFSNAYTPERMDQLWKAGATQILTKASSTPNVLLEAVRKATEDKG